MSDYRLRVTTTMVVHVRPKTGGPWVRLDGQPAGQTWEQAQDIVRRKVGKLEEAAIFEHFECWRRINAERR